MADRTRSSSPCPRRRTLNPSFPVPGPRRFVSSLLAAIPRPPPAPVQSMNPLTDGAAAGPVLKDIFLALHVIFPNELLPALDVLDRGLVLRLRTLRRSSSSTDVRPSGLLLVRSAQQQRPSYHRHSATEHVAYYEVRLDAWSCSCPTFAFSVFRARSTEPTGDYGDDDDEKRDAGVTAVARENITVDGDEAAFRFGGCSRGHDLPVCKHLLACALVEHCAAFAHLAEDREVTEEEMAGWAAGWGD